MANEKRRKACDCVHFFRSGFDGSKKCGMFETLVLAGKEVRVHMTRDCRGVCFNWENKGED